MQRSPALNEVERQQRLSEWSASSGVELSQLDTFQRAVVLAALMFLSFVGDVPALRRLVAYLLSHCGLGLSSTVIGAVVGLTDRAVRKGRQLGPKEFWTRLQTARRGRPPSKLRPEQVGPVAKFLAEHKSCSVAEVLDFIRTHFGVQMDRHTLSRFLQRYGMGCLRQEAVVDTPLLSGAP